MNDYTTIHHIGLNKINSAKQNPKVFFVKSILAGFYLGGAMILSYTLGALFVSNPPLSKLLIASTFGIGIIAISFLGAELFTGNCFTTMIPVYSKEISFSKVLPSWIYCYIGNMLGMSFIAILFIISQSDSPMFNEYLRPLFDNKLNFTIFPLFLKGVLCNFAVCIAAYAGIRIKDPNARLILMLFFVCAFVIAGLEHCIANSGFFAMCFTAFGTNADWSMFLPHMFLSTIGNIVGGSILLAYPVYYTIKDKR